MCNVNVCKYRNYSIGGITEDSQGGRVGKIGGGGRATEHLGKNTAEDDFTRVG